MRVISIIVLRVDPGDPDLHKSAGEEELPSLLNKRGVNFASLLSSFFSSPFLCKCFTPTPRRCVSAGLGPGVLGLECLAEVGACVSVPRRLRYFETNFLKICHEIFVCRCLPLFVPPPLQSQIE